MVIRFFLILASLVAIGVVGTFLLYVSALSLLTTIAVGIGLAATWYLGFSAGSVSLEPAPKVKRLHNLSVINGLLADKRSSI
jgi:hypothetical protein